MRWFNAQTTGWVLMALCFVVGTSVFITGLMTDNAASAAVGVFAIMSGFLVAWALLL